MGRVDKKDTCFGAGAKENTPHKVRCATWKRQLAAGTPGAIRTRDLSLRRRTLYPAELRAHGKKESRPLCFEKRTYLSFRSLLYGIPFLKSTKRRESTRVWFIMGNPAVGKRVGSRRFLKFFVETHADLCDNKKE